MESGRGRRLYGEIKTLVGEKGSGSDSEGSPKKPGLKRAQGDQTQTLNFKMATERFKQKYNEKARAEPPGATTVI